MHERHLFGADFEPSVFTVVGQVFQLRQQLDHLGCARSVRIDLRLYDMKVWPLATYGLCVWATRFCVVSPVFVVVSIAMEKQHLAWLRSWCHLRGFEHNRVILADVNMLVRQVCIPAELGS